MLDVQSRWAQLHNTMPALRLYALVFVLGALGRFGGVQLPAGLRQSLRQAASAIDALLGGLGTLSTLLTQGQALFDLHRLRVQARPYGIQKIDAGPAVMNIHFRPNPPIDPMRIIELVQKNRHIKLAGNDKLRIERALEDPKARAQMVRDVLKSLGQPLRAETPATA